MPNATHKIRKAKPKGLPTVVCDCGEEILLVPDVKLMSKALEAHAEIHKRKIEDPNEAEAEAQRVMDDLIQKVLIKACEA